VLQSGLQTVTNLGASSGTTSSCNPSGAYGGLFGSPGGCDIGPDSTAIAGQGGSGASDGDSGSSTFVGYVTEYVPVAEQSCGVYSPVCGIAIEVAMQNT
jgi:hypothetical protein